MTAPWLTATIVVALAALGGFCWREAMTLWNRSHVWQRHSIKEYGVRPSGKRARRR